MPEYEDSLSALAGMIEVPPGAVPVSGTIVVSYLTEDGAAGWGVGFLGDERTTHVIGLLEMVKFELLSNPQES